jgi:hypothetical protein
MKMLPSCSPEEIVFTYKSAEGQQAVAQAVSCWLHAMVAWIQSQVKVCGICGRQSGTGPGFLQALQLPLSLMLYGLDMASIIK